MFTKKIIVFLLLLIITDPARVFALEIRVYCRTDGVVFEKHGNGVSYSDGDKIYDVPAFLIEEADIPAHEYGEQLKCNSSGTALIVDTTIITPRIQRLQAKAEAQRRYDAELARESPDVVLLMRLNRDLELISQENQEAIQRYLTVAP